MLSRADEIRKKYLYRRLIQSGRLKLPLKTARRLLGPDTAYHLYNQQDNEKPAPQSTKESGEQ